MKGRDFLRLKRDDESSNKKGDKEMEKIYGLMHSKTPIKPIDPIVQMDCYVEFIEPEWISDEKMREVLGDDYPLYERLKNELK